MTYNDLCTEVAALGFESEIENDELILLSAKRALRLLFTDRPMYKSVRFYQNPIYPSQTHEDFSHECGSVYTVEFKARAYTFKTNGEGSYKITDEQGERSFDFSQAENLHRGFLYGTGYIEFFGNYFYTVYDFALYDEITGPSESDIPEPCAFCEYDVGSYASDFLSFISLPKGDNGHSIYGSSVCAGIIKIPRNYSGNVFLDYKAAPQTLSGAPDEEIITPDGCEHLLALLVASYAWLDDDAEKAQYYMNLYREALSAVKFYDRPRINNEYYDITGWT